MPQPPRPVSAAVSSRPVGQGSRSEVRYSRAEPVGAAPSREIEDLRAWELALRSASPLHGLRLQGLDLTVHRDLLLARDDLSDVVVLGGRLDPEVDEHLRLHGAIVFPAVHNAPVDPYRAHLYTPDELYARLAERGYADTLDARAYRWFEDATVRHDAYVTALRAIHDDAMSDALAALVDGRRAVGVMGGHALRRGNADYAAAALLGHRLARSGALVLTGGGPGAMEAANLGAWARDEQVLHETLAAVATAPDFAPDVAAWAGPALAQRHAHPDDPAQAVRSVGIPTWYYGHEPPNVFAQAVAKFFSNALREDLLLAHSRGALVVLPGAAGTVQEVFQMATRLYYEVDADGPLSPLVLIGVDHWTRRLPVWPLLTALGDGRRMATALHLVDTVDEAAGLLT